MRHCAVSCVVASLAVKTSLPTRRRSRAASVFLRPRSECAWSGTTITSQARGGRLATECSFDAVCLRHDEADTLARRELSFSVAQLFGRELALHPVPDSRTDVAAVKLLALDDRYCHHCQRCAEPHSEPVGPEEPRDRAERPRRTPVRVRSPQSPRRPTGDTNGRQSTATRTSRARPSGLPSW